MKLILLLFCVLQISTAVLSVCVNMWDAKYGDKDICSVQTTSGVQCAFPFTYYNQKMYNCIIGGPGNPANQPQCITTAGTWSACIVPTDAMVRYVTTRKSGSASQNGASVNGETLLWIYGSRFAANSLSMIPTTASSNKVLLESSLASYECEIHLDKTTETQITCWTPASMPEGTYFVRVFVNNYLVPYYQYANTGQAVIKVNYGSTPILNSISPVRGIPGSFISVNGKFNSACYSRDLEGCASDGGSRITRVYFGAQLCDLMDQDSMELYDVLTSSYLKCKLKGTTVGIFNASMIVSEDNGRSVAQNSMYYVTPDELIYNYQSYAEITSVSPNGGSTEGASTVTITGKYLYHSSTIPAKISIAGSTCDVVSFDDTDQLQTRITCETAANQPIKTEYIGNRGVNVQRENIYTAFASLATASPSANAETTQWLDDASFRDDRTVDLTIWMTGFLAPAKKSDYFFSLTTNSLAQLYLSTDETSANKQLVASYDGVTSTTSTQSLEGGKMYYFQVIASRKGGKLNLDVNTKMFNALLTGTTSTRVKTESQEIEILSDIVYEAMNITYNPTDLAAQEANGVAEVQDIEIVPLAGDSFILNFDGADTVPLSYSSTEDDVEKALNDLPTLASEPVSVTSQETANGVQYTVTFTTSRGDVPEITEVLKNAGSTITETVKGVPSHKKFQLKIRDAWSNLFDVQTDSVATINDAIEEVFRIRCPFSIQKLDPLTTSRIFDYENECQYGDAPLEQTAYCGKCALQNKDVLFWGVNSPMAFNLMCFAYKITSEIQYIGINAFFDGDTTTAKDAYIWIDTQADDKWHYKCVNLHEGLLANWGVSASQYPRNKLTLVGAWIYPLGKSTLIDVVSLRKVEPPGYVDGGLATDRRIFPELQMVYKTLTVSRDTVNNVLTVSYKPNNCTNNLPPSELRQSLATIGPNIAIVTSASGPVEGNFDLAWNGESLNGVPNNATAVDMRNLLQSIKGMGNVRVTRSKDCAGFKWKVDWFDGGDKAPFSVPSNALTGINVQTEVKTLIDGGIEFYPIPGDMLRTAHSKPQFSVFINGIPSKCSSNCEFEWLSAQTPTVSNIDTTNPAEIVLTGSGFDASTNENNIVSIGSTPCVVSASTATTLKCVPGDGPVGTFAFKVKVIPNGLAKMNSAATFTFSLTITAISPLVVGTGGGNILQVDGTGFSSATTIKVDGNACVIKTVSYKSLTCVVPSNPTAVDKLVDVDAIDGSYTARSATQLKYDAVNTPIVTNVSLYQKLSVTGGQTITIDGLLFNPAIGQVFVGDEPAKIDSFTSTKIVIKSPSMKPGLYDLIIPSGRLGNAKTSVQIEYTLYVASFSPNSGSIRGGTIVRVIGDGFSTSSCDSNKVLFGGESVCKVLDCASNWIKCETTNAKKVHKIDNGGKDPYFGTGYAWSKPYLTINEGDYVQWSWDAPGAISNINYAVEQVDDPTSYVATTLGFSSRPSSASGSFTYQFNKVGVYYYWSGFVDSNNQISFRGVINVVPSVDRVLSISVRIDKYEAQKCVFPFTYKSQTYTSCINLDSTFSWCSPTSEYNGQKLECSPTVTVPADTCPGPNANLGSCSSITSPSAYDFRFTTCTIPTITSISSLQASAGDEIIIQGTDFSLTNCEDSVLIGSYSCPITAITSTEIKCQIGVNSALNTQIGYPIEVKVKNLGNAIQNDWYEFKFVPKISQIFPRIGSSEGGTVITIEGDGFNPDFTVVQLAGQYYTKENAQITYNQIKIETAVYTNAIEELSVTVSNVKALCSASPDCLYEFSSSIAPTLTSITPTSLSDSTVFTISGTLFGTDPTLISVKIGTQTATVTSVTNTDITCSLSNLNLGQQNVVVNLKDVGRATQPSPVLKVEGLPTVKSLLPNTGSIYGDTVITITGNGFDQVQNTEVKIGTKLCTIVSVSISSVACRTPANAAGDTVVSIKSAGVSYPSQTFKYDLASTPSITSISPTSGPTGTLITLTGTGFGTIQSDVSVMIGTVACTIQSITNTQITCTAGSNSAGSYTVSVNVKQKGLTNTDKSFRYSLIVSSVSPVEGSYGGGLTVTLVGSGFAGASTQVTICSSACIVDMTSTASQVTCTVPAKSYSSPINTVCQLVVTVNVETYSTSFTYKSSLTPTVSSLSPAKGGTAGGTIITISGNGFPVDKTKIKVTIAGSVCIVSTVSVSSITCETGPFTGSTIVAPVLVFVQDSGFASNDASATFKYIDLWSSKFTWGGVSTPQEGELVVVGPGQTVYLDTTTAILKGLIVQGGALIFDDNQDVVLNAEYIIVADGGRIECGTRAKPFTKNAKIIMHGTLRSMELPIFGSKVIAIRNGTLDLHGMPVGVTWTYLEATAVAQSAQIRLADPVTWPLGAQIIIATTGDKLSQGQSEIRTINAVSADGRTLTLNAPLKFDHLGEKRTVSGVDVYLRAEVGLLSRNVQFTAINDDSWNALRSAQACPEGFNPGEFATMTCFLGRYGDEIGSDEFGATIMFNGAKRNSIGNEEVIGRLSNVEFSHVGQAFRLGRYPIHFHMLGDSPSSYVSECAIHESFNRAVNIHATNYVTVEKTVIYNIMGGAFFLEDGVEIGNTFQYNLAVFVKSSSSLLNEDVTPAGFWATNPNNTWQHNAVAGGSHFGYWFRLLENPDGPSFNPNYCPRKIPLGRFYNNSVHSVGRFGLWVFPAYTPTASGNCRDSTPFPAKFEGLVAYHCDKGAEWVASNSLHFKGFIVYDHTTAGIETKQIAGHSSVNSGYGPYFYSDTLGPMVADSIVIGQSSASSSVTPRGLVVAWDRGELVKNVRFINFPTGTAIGVTEIIGTCTFGCGGWETRFEAVRFDNVQTRTAHRWAWDVIFKDNDGSLTGTAGNVVVSATTITDNDSGCKKNNLFAGATVCANTNTWIRFSFNNMRPSGAVFIQIKNEAGSIDRCPKLKKSLTHPEGYSFAIEANQEYEINFEQAVNPTNMSYVGTFYGLEPNQYLIIKHKLLKQPDQVYLFGKSLARESLYPLTVEKSQNGDWYWDDDTRTLSYIINNNQGRKPFLDIPVNFAAIKCRYPDCKIPDQPALRLPLTKPAPDRVYWSNESAWELVLVIKASRSYTGSQFPSAGDSIRIPDYLYLVVDVALPRLNRIEINGYLEFLDSRDHEIVANAIFINGGQLIVGWENKPFTHKMLINLTGTADDLNLILPNGFDTAGAKAIGVYGGLDLHGVKREPVWTRLAQTVLIGDNVLRLAETVDWTVGEEIVVSTTSFSVMQTETFKIAAVSADKRTLTLSEAVKYNHIVAQETFANGKSYSVAAGVGLLTRNIQIVGGEYPDQQADLFGFRILVSDYAKLVYPEDSNTPIVVYYKGFARFSNVAFNRGGQYSRNDDEDYKYAVLYSNLQGYDSKRPSYVRNCSFYNSLAGTVGVLGSDSIPIEYNVIHRALDYAIRVVDSHAVIRNNLITMTLWSSTFMLDAAAYDRRFWAAVDIRSSVAAILEDNLIAGAHRIGVYYRGSPCPGLTLPTTFTHSIKRNSIYGAMAGVTIFPNSAYQLSCIHVTGFTVFKSTYLGLYYQGASNVLIEDNVLIDNQLNIFPQIFGPSAVSHSFNPNRRMDIKNNLIIGTSPSFSCTHDKILYDTSLQYAHYAVSYGARNNGRIGVVWSNFISKGNGAPTKPWCGIMSYNALNGLSNIEGNTFAYFNKSCGNAVDAMITSSQANEDGQMPVQVHKTIMYNVDQASKLFLHRPSLGSINPSDCVDMNCDGLKKNLLTDLDGSLLGSPGTIVSQSEFEWGSQRRGLGDYRIPKEALSDAKGKQRNVSEVYSYPGIVRNETLCQYKEDWQAHECHGIEHKIMIIESMDSDTESRRLSPVAILSDNKYLDLVNGPQDHGWCAGYTCQRRLSTFLTIVAGKQNYDVYLTSTPPNRLRFRIINADSNFKIRLSMYYFVPNNVNVYKGSAYVDPTNADRSTGSLRLLDPNSNLNAYMPTYNSACGTNFMYRPDRKIYFALDGSSTVDLVISEEIFLTFGVRPVTSITFFNSANLVNNVALLLDVPASMIRRVEIVRETGSTRVARQTADMYLFLVVISADAVTDVNDETGRKANQDLIGSISFKTAISYHTGQLQSNALASGLDIESLTMVTTPFSSAGNVSVPLKEFGSIVATRNAAQCNAQSVCVVQPNIQILDTENNAVNISQVANELYVVATVIQSSPTTTVLYQTKKLVDYKGIATFHELALSDQSDGIIIRYTLEANGTTLAYTYDSPSFSVGKPSITIAQNETETKVEYGKAFSAYFFLADKISKRSIPNPTWKGQSWSACATLYKLEKWQPEGAVLSPSQSCSNLNLATKQFEFKNLNISKIGMYLLNVTVASPDGDDAYNLASTSNVIRVDLATELAQTAPENEAPNLAITWTGVFVEADTEKYKATVFNLLKHYSLSVVGSVYAYPGSLIVTTNAYGNSSDFASLNATLASTTVFSNFELHSFSYEGSTYTVPLKVLPMSDHSSTNSVGSDNAGAIAGGVVGAVALIALVVASAVLAKKYKKSPHDATASTQEMKQPRKKLLTEDVYSEEPIESVTVARPNSVLAMSRLNLVKTPDGLFTQQRGATTLSSIQFEDA